MITTPLMNCIHGVALAAKCITCVELATDTHKSGRFIAARDGVEAQRGLNDVFPGDSYFIAGKRIDV